MQKNLCTELEQNWRSEKSDVCKESFLLDYLPEGDTTVRETHGKTAITGGQGFEKCKTGCNTNRCKS